jgi:arylsulfatase A-like enzyme
MKRKPFLQKNRPCQAIITSLTALFIFFACRSAEQQPNIVIIITDDQGYADLSASPGHAKDIHTPNMDRLANGGMLCTQSYVAAPVCSPSRAGWNTGLYQQRWDPKSGWNPGVPENVKTVAEFLKAAGYITGKVGKSDFGTGYHRQDVREYPLNHGYDEFLGFSSHAHDFFLLSADIEKRTPDPYGHSAALGTLFENQTRKSYDDGYTTEIFTDWAIDFLKRHRDERFFLNVSYNAVHHLIHEVPQQYLDKFGVEQIADYDPETMGKYEDYYRTYCKLDPISDKDIRQYYLANLNCLDDNIGRLLDAMEKSGLLQNTLIIFFSDNGGSPLTGANNQPLRGSKYNLYEGGIRVPFIVHWPSRIKANSIYPHRLSTLDILPTCLDAAGIDIPGSLDGTTFLGSLETGKPAPSGAQPLFWQFHDQFAVRDGDWKLIKSSDYARRKATSQILSGPPGAGGLQLFNLADDNSEQNNVYDQHPETAGRLEQLMADWQTEMNRSHDTVLSK